MKIDGTNFRYNPHKSLMDCPAVQEDIAMSRDQQKGYPDPFEGLKEKEKKDNVNKRGRERTSVLLNFKFIFSPVQSKLPFLPPRSASQSQLQLPGSY
jgi:hypothetical protein